MNSQLASINTNYTLLASSSLTSITWTDSTSDTNMKDAKAADAKSGKKKLYKKFIYNEFTFTYSSSYIEKMDRNIMFNISVSSVLTSAIESATSMNATPTMEADTTSGKTNICKNIINNKLRLKICILIYVKNRKYENNQQS